MEKKNNAVLKIGVWMDHSDAKLIDPEKSAVEIRTIHSVDSSKNKFRGEESDGIRLGNFRSSNNEFSKHRKDENADHEYFKHLADVLQGFHVIFIFGPTTAGHEFKNYLIKEKRFSDKEIVIEKSDYITEPQMFKLVKDHFISNA